MDNPFIGQLMPAGFNWAPRGWAPCNGQILNISQNTALFSLIGTSFGGNGQTTFALPDLRGRSIVHIGQGPGLSNISIGETGGAESVTLTVQEMPAHTHPATATATATSTLYGEAVIGDNPNMKNRMLAGTSANPYKSPDPAQNNAFDPGAIVTTATVAVTVGTAGGSQPTPIRSPFLGINVCIALQGLFPSRN